MTAFAEKHSKSNAAILIGVLLVMGLVLGGIGLSRYQAGKASTAWPFVKAQITYSHASYHKGEPGSEYMPTVKYSYTVTSKRYTGNRITASDVYEKSKSGADDILRQYPVGGQVSVYYDPENPGSSLLKVGVKQNIYIMMAGALACFFFAIAIGVSARKKHG